MNRQSMQRCCLFVLGVLLGNSAWAGLPVVSILGNPHVSFSSPQTGTSTTQTLTLTYDSNGATGESAEITALSLAGANAGDFTIIGGTCDPGTTMLTSSNTTCTVVVRYTPSTAAAETAQLNGSCETFGLIGGFTLLCTGGSGELTSLSGAVIASFVTAPLLDSRVLTLLCVLMLAGGVYVARRKPAAQR